MQIKERTLEGLNSIGFFTTKEPVDGVKVPVATSQDQWGAETVKEVLSEIKGLEMHNEICEVSLDKDKLREIAEKYDEKYGDEEVFLTALLIYHKNKKINAGRQEDEELRKEILEPRYAKHPKTELDDEYEAELLTAEQDACEEWGYENLERLKIAAAEKYLNNTIAYDAENFDGRRSKNLRELIHYKKDLLDSAGPLAFIGKAGTSVGLILTLAGRGFCEISSKALDHIFGLDTTFNEHDVSDVDELWKYFLKDQYLSEIG